MEHSATKTASTLPTPKIAALDTRVHHIGMDASACSAEQRKYFYQHRHAIEEAIEDAMTAAFTAAASDPVSFIGRFLLRQPQSSAQAPMGPPPLTRPPSIATQPSSWAPDVWARSLGICEIACQELLLEKPIGMDDRVYICSLDKIEVARRLGGTLSEQITERFWMGVCRSEERR